MRLTGFPTSLRTAASPGSGRVPNGIIVMRVIYIKSFPIVLSCNLVYWGSGPNSAANPYIKGEAGVCTNTTIHSTMSEESTGSSQPDVSPLERLVSLAPELISMITSHLDRKSLLAIDNAIPRRSNVALGLNRWSAEAHRRFYGHIAITSDGSHTKLLKAVQASRDTPQSWEGVKILEIE